MAAAVPRTAIKETLFLGCSFYIMCYAAVLLVGYLCLSVNYNGFVSWWQFVLRRQAPVTIYQILFIEVYFFLQTLYLQKISQF